MTQPARANMLHDLGYKIFLDRYALKDMTRETLAVGDIVVALVDPDTRQREIGTVDAIDLPQITITLRDGTTVTCNIEEVDKPLETDPGQMMDRVARGVAAVEVSEAGQAQWAERFRWLLEDWKFVPGGRILAAAGTSQNLTFYNCYVLPSPDDSRDGIIETLRQMTEIMSRGGGVGINISSLRPRYAYVRGVNGRSSGTVSWGELYSFVTGLIEQGGCLIPDTLVFTENGLLRLDEMVQHTERGWREQTITVKTDQGERVSRRVYNNGVADVLSVQTDMGLTLIGTPNHKVKVMTDEGPVWRELEHLQTGDAILVKLNQHQGKLQTLEHPEYHHFNQVEVDLPTVVDEDLAFFLGYFMGDGFMTTREGDWRLGVAVAHSSYLVDEMPKMLERLFPGVNVRIQQKDEDASLIYLISNRALKEFLILNGLDKPASDAVHIPRLIRQSPREVVGAFLSGLFEADGGISHHYPSLSSISKRLIDETATLLIGLGCPVRIDQFPYSEDRFGSNPVWRLRVHSVRGLQAWKATIGCDPRSRYAACMGFEPDLNRESTYVLPNPEYWGEPVLAATMLPQGDFRATGQRFKATDGKLRRKLLRYKRGDRNLTLSAYMTLEKTHDAFARHARPVNDTWFVFVDSVEPAGQSLTLDLEVDENHTYLANGLVTHNSRRGALMLILNDWHPDILEFTNVKRNMDRMNNANISVGVSDRLMAAIENDEDWDLVFPDTDEPGYDDLWDGDLDKWIADGHKVIHYETVKARDLWNAIIESAWASAEPGIWFRERTNKLSNSHYFSPLISTNPCVTGDTLLYTDQGLQRAQELFDDETQIEVTVDGRFGLAGATTPASRVFRTGTKPVFRLQTKEGYFVRATADHRFMTPRGWVELQDLAPGDKLHILNRKGGFGGEGSLALGRVLGAANTRAIQQPVVAMQQAKNETIRSGLQTRSYNDTLHLVPETVFMGCVDMQRGFLQAFFTDHADFQHGEICCLSDQCELLEGVQQILLNFGIASRINRNYQELTISDQNIFAFVDEIGFLMDYKQAALTDYITRGKRGPYREAFTATVEAITEDGIEDVFDVTEPITHSIVVNGLVAHNCGEQPLSAWSVCNLGAINLAKFYDAEAHDVAWDDLRTTARYAARFLDNVIDSTPYFFEENHQQQMSERRVGLGTMGLAELMIRLGIRYGSDESLAFIDKLYEFLATTIYEMSTEIAQEKGSFPQFDAEQFLQSGYMRGMPERIRDLVRERGIRNVTLMTQAPTGTTGSMTNTSTGIEPFFSWNYYRKSRLGLHEEHVPLVRDWFAAHPDATDLPDYFVTAMDLTPLEHVKVQAAIQRWVDSAISKTSNVPNDYTVEQTRELYESMYQLGCKGGTIYRDGSRDEQVLMLKEEETETMDQAASHIQHAKSEQLMPQVASSPNRVYPRPNMLRGVTVSVKTPFGTGYITMNTDNEGNPFEVFVTIGKAGSDLQADAEGLGRMISLLLRTTAPQNRLEMLKLIIDQLRNIGGVRSVGLGNGRVSSLPDAVAGTLEKYYFQSGGEQLQLPGLANDPQPGINELDSGFEIGAIESAHSGLHSGLHSGNGHSPASSPTAKRPSGMDMCPSCGTISLVRTEGCRKCLACGYSEC